MSPAVLGELLPLFPCQSAAQFTWEVGMLTWETELIHHTAASAHYGKVAKLIQGVQRNRPSWKDLLSHRIAPSQLH